MIYSREKLESIAENINRLYFPERLSMPSILDPYDLLEAMGCDYEWKYISPNDSILGITFFCDGYWHIWPRGTLVDGDRPYVENFKKGTVVINQRVLDAKGKNAIPSERFIVTHEAAHWIKDKDYFETHPSSVLQTCFQNDFTKTIWNNNMSELEVIERQASYLCAAILMPREVIIDAFFKAGRYKHRPTRPVEYRSYMRKWIADISLQFGINFNPVKYRLKDLEIICEEG